MHNVPAVFILSVRYALMSHLKVCVPCFAFPRRRASPFLTLFPRCLPPSLPPSRLSILSVRTSMHRTVTTAPTRKVCFQRVTAAEASRWSSGRSTRAAGRLMLSTRTLRRKPSSKWRRRRLLGRCKHFERLGGDRTCMCAHLGCYVGSVLHIFFVSLFFPMRTAWLCFGGGFAAHSVYDSAAFFGRLDG